MNTFTLSIILITLSVIDFFAIEKYRLIEMFYSYGQPVEIAFALGIMGFILLVVGIKK